MNAKQERVTREFELEFPEDPHSAEYANQYYEARRRLDNAVLAFITNRGGGTFKFVLEIETK